GAISHELADAGDVLDQTWIEGVGLHPCSRGARLGHRVESPRAIPTLAGSQVTLGPQAVEVRVDLLGKRAVVVWLELVARLTGEPLVWRVLREDEQTLLDSHRIEL